MEAYEHVTATQFWFVNILHRPQPTCESHRSVDAIAEDIDCPELAMNEFSPFNLIKFEEYVDPNSPPVPITMYASSSASMGTSPGSHPPSPFDVDDLMPKMPDGFNIDDMPKMPDGFNIDDMPKMPDGFNIDDMPKMPDGQHDDSRKMLMASTSTTCRRCPTASTSPTCR